MSTIVTRSGKGSPLTHTEVDSNFTNLNTDKLETAGGSMTGNLSFGDNDKAIFGAGSDLQIYHDGFNSYIDDTATGFLNLRGDSRVKIGSVISGETMAEFIADGAVNLYYNNAVKLATTSTGIDVTGTVTADGLTVSDTQASGGVGIDIINVGDGGISTTPYTYIASKLNPTRNGGEIRFTRANTYGSAVQADANIELYTTVDDVNKLALKVHSGGDISFYEDTGTTAKFFWDASAERLGLGTTSPAAVIDAQGTQSFLGNFQRTDAGVAAIRISGQDGEAVVIQMGDASDGDIQRITSDNSDNSMYFHTSNTERMRIDSSGRVGIGESSISGYNGYGDGLIVKKASVSGSSGITVQAPANTGYSSVYFGDPDDTKVAGLEYNHNNDTLNIQVNNAERMRIDASGNLLVGKTVTTLNTEGHALAPTYARFTRSGAAPVQFNRTTSDGDITIFYKDGATVGSIGSASGQDIYIGSGAVGLRFRDATIDTIRPYNTSTGNDVDGTVDLGLSTARFKDLYLSGGVYLGGTGAANKLDDYEEGTWTPSVNSGTANFANARYIKIGQMVTVFASMQDISDYTSALDIIIGGIPFTSSSANSAVGSAMFRYFGASGRAQMNSYISASATTMTFYWSPDSNASWNAVEFGDGAQANMDIIFSLTYRTDS